MAFNNPLIAPNNAGQSPAFVIGNTISTLNNLSPTTAMAVGTGLVPSGQKVATITLPANFSFKDLNSYVVTLTEVSTANADASGKTYAAELISGTQFKIHSNSAVAADTTIAYQAIGQS